MFVVAWPGEDFESLFLRFKRGMERVGILREARRRRHFVPNHERRREARRKGIRRQNRGR